MTINLNNAKFLTSVFDTRKINITPKPEIVLAGRSNVGKSSMINRLLNRKSIARVSGTPGKTISANYYDIDGKIYLVDLPGYGFAKRAAAEKTGWGRLVNGYFGAGRDIRLVLLLVDIRHDPSDEDMQMFEYLMAGETLFCVVATKSDKLSKTEIKKRTDALSATFGVEVIPFSAENGTGTNEIWDIIEDITVNAPGSTVEEIL